MQVETISIIGLNLLSASAGLAIKKKLPSLTIIGCDPDGDKSLLDEAKALGAIDQDVPVVRNAIRRGDIIILANQPHKTIEILAQYGADVKEHAVITDFGPLKKPIQAAADKFLRKGFYVGSMPIVNVDQAMQISNHRLNGATDALFQNSLFCLMPSSKVEQGAVDTISGIGSVFGCKPFFVDPDEFDVYAQALETLPNLLTLALFKSLRAQTGWGDLERLASLSFLQMVKPGADDHFGIGLGEQVVQNKTSTIHWINVMMTHLGEIKSWIEEADDNTLKQLFDESARDQAVWINRRRENDWSETSGTDEASSLSFNNLLFGNLANRFTKRD
ncbi:MAG: prephenate dehydrogenase/arogenate dehydrogenase family protein [Chloroflexota bacterium]